MIEYIKKSDIDDLMMDLIHKTSDEDMLEAGKLVGLMMVIDKLPIYASEEEKNNEI